MIIVLSPAKTLDYDFDFSNQHSVPTFLNQSSKLIKLLKKNNISWSGDIIFARYNSPWTLWFLKKNEIIVQLD